MKGSERRRPGRVASRVFLAHAARGRSPRGGLSPQATVLVRAAAALVPAQLDGRAHDASAPLGGRAIRPWRWSWSVRARGALRRSDGRVAGAEHDDHAGVERTARARPDGTSQARAPRPDLERGRRARPSRRGPGTARPSSALATERPSPAPRRRRSSTLACRGGSAAELARSRLSTRRAELVRAQDDPVQRAGQPVAAHAAAVGREGHGREPGTMPWKPSLPLFTVAKPPA